MDQSKRLMRANEGIFMRKSVCNCSHSSVGISAFLVLEKSNALSGNRRHFLICFEIWSGRVEAGEFIGNWGGRRNRERWRI